MENNVTRAGARPASSRVFVARLVDTTVFDPIGDPVGKVHDVIVLIRMRGDPRAVGFVIDVSGRRRVFLPLSRVTAINPGQVITTGLVNIRRFEQRKAETLVVGELLDRVVTLRDGSGRVTIRDVAIEPDRNKDWKVTRLFVQRASSGPLGLRRGETLMVRPEEVSGLATGADQQGATALLATLEDLKAADLADVMRDLPQDSQMRVAAELTDERLEALNADESSVIILRSVHTDSVNETRAAILRLRAAACQAPVILRRDYHEADLDRLRIAASADLGVLLIDGIADGLLLTQGGHSTPDTDRLAFGILQATRRRMSRTEYISCPGCGRTLYDLHQTISRIKAATGHLKGVKIGIMGCIVNGPGEMADADYGYVGAGPGRVSLYRGKECVLRSIPEAEAVDRLLELIASDRK